jgi:methylenetetrahydrofolate reductase (NADH)
MKSGSNLERVLEAGEFAVTVELGPPMDCNAEVVLEKARVLKGCADAYNLTDNQTAVVRLSSIAAAVLIMREGLEPVMQMTCRDRNRIAIQGDLLSAAALGIRNMLCLTGDGIANGDEPDAKPVFDLDVVSLLDTETGDAAEAVSRRSRQPVHAAVRPAGDPAGKEDRGRSPVRADPVLL